MMNDFYKFTMEADASKPARLDLFGTVGGSYWEDGFNESEFSDSMKGLKETQPLDVYINSPGGSVYTGMAILNLLKKHKGAVCIYVMGIAASAATLITSAPNAKVVMPTGSMMMIHLPALYAGGNKNELRKQVELLEKIEKNVVNVYKEKTGLSEKEISEMIADETWMTAEEAVEKGFADEVDTETKIENSVSDKAFMFGGVSAPVGMFKKFPERILNKLNRISEKNSTLQNEEDKMTLEEMKEKYPELCSKLCADAKAEGVKEGTASERQRIKALEEMALAGHEEILAKAKFETGISAEQMAVEIVKAEKASREASAQAHGKDAKDLAEVLDGISATEDPTASMGNKPKSEEEKMVDEFTKAAKAELNKGAI